MNNEIGNIRFYSPIYDSVMQRRFYNLLAKTCKKSEYNLKEINSQYIKIYNSILRWDILVFGKVYITDSMWIDSTYFAKFIEADEKEFDSFVEAACENNFFEVEFRKNPMDIFSKPFYFSSIESIELRNALVEIAKDEKYFKEIPTDNLDNYFNAINNNTIKNIELPDNIKNRIRKLFDSKILRSAWQENAQKKFNDAFNDEKEVMKKAISDNNLQELDYIKEIWKEINKEGFPLRSIIEDNINKSYDLGNAGLIYKFDECFTKGYNMAIAESQDFWYADFYYDFQKKLFTRDNKNQILDILVELLGQMSWQEFSSIYADQKLKDLREDWVNNYESNIHFNELINYICSVKLGCNCIYNELLLNKMILFSSKGIDRLWVPMEFTTAGIECNKDCKKLIKYKECDVFSDNNNIIGFFTEDFDKKVLDFLLNPILNDENIFRFLSR